MADIKTKDNTPFLIRKHSDRIIGQIRLARHSKTQ